jgi:hypothetical protein
MVDTLAPGEDNAPRSRALPNVLMIGFGVQLRIRQHHTEGSAACRHIEQPRQSACVAPWPLTRPRRQQNLLLHIHDNQPLQPRATRPGSVGLLLQAPQKESADGPAPGTQSSHWGHRPSTVSANLVDPAPGSPLGRTGPSGHQTIEATPHFEDASATPKPWLSDRTTQSSTQPSTSAVIFEPVDCKWPSDRT